MNQELKLQVLILQIIVKRIIAFAAGDSDKLVIYKSAIKHE